MRNLFGALGLSALVLTGCTAAEVDTTTQTYQQKIETACSIAEEFAGLDPAIGIYVTAACGTEEEIAKLVLDGNSLNWLTGLISQLENKSPQ